MANKSSSQLILMRHGESEWNHLNVFTGWVDIPLSLKGVEESLKGGKAISFISIDVIFVSSLVRSLMTAMLAMAENKRGKIPKILHDEEKLEKWSTVYNTAMNERCIPVITAWQLNERMYGRLQGMNKDEARRQFGPEQVHLWRRSYDQAPPEGESLEMTGQRALPFFNEMILPYLKQDKNVFICAHGNSLRAIVMHIEKLSKQEVIQLEIPTGKPLIYQYSNEIWEKNEN